MRANFEIVREECSPGCLVIRDCGDHSRQPTITNDAEGVVSYIVNNCDFPEGTRLFYYDSMGQLDELLIQDGRFAGFAPGPGYGFRSPGGQLVPEPTAAQQQILSIALADPRGEVRAEGLARQDCMALVRMGRLVRLEYGRFCLPD